MAKKSQKTAGKTAKKRADDQAKGGSALTTAQESADREDMERDAMQNFPVGKHELAPGVSLEVSEEKKDRVVLALSTEQAQRLLNWMDGKILSSDEPIKNIAQRIQKTLNKQAVLKEFEKQGIVPTKEQIIKALEVANGK